MLVSASAVGFYGKHGDERVDEDAAAGGDFLAGVCVAWEREARAAGDLGMRVVLMRTGVVLDPTGGALKTMLPPFRAGVGGPVAGGAQYMPWIHVDDVVGMYLTALDDAAWTGPVNVTAPEPATNRDFSKALGRALHRPADRARPGDRAAPALRRHGRDRHRGPARRPRPRAGARLRVPAAGAGRRARRRARLRPAGLSRSAACGRRPAVRRGRGSR